MTSEKSIEQTIVAEAKALGIVSFKLQGGHVGDPDRIMVYKNRCVLVEFKQPGGLLSNAQRARIAWLMAQGVTAGVVWDLDQGRWLIQRIIHDEDFGDWIH